MPVLIAAASLAAGALAGVLARRRQAPLVVGTVLDEAPVQKPPRNEDVGALVQKLCERRVPGVVMDPRSGWSSAIRFESLEPEVMSLSLSGQPPTAPLPPGVQLVVQFNHEGRARMFMVALVHLAWGPPESRRLRLAVPAQVAFGEARAAFRVTLDRIEPVYVEMQHGHGASDARVRDLSATGVGVRFGQADDPMLEVGDAVVLRMDARGHRIERSATVRRVSRPEYGLSFDAAVDDENREHFDLLLRQLIDEVAA